MHLQFIQAPLTAKKTIMKAIIFFFFLFNLTNNSFSQQNNIESLKHELETAQNDTLKLVLLTTLSGKYLFNNKFDSALNYARRQLFLSQKLFFKIDEAYTFDMIGVGMMHLDDPGALGYLFRGLSLAEDPKIETNVLPNKYFDRLFYSDPIVNISKDRWTPHNLRLEMLGALYYDLGNFYGFGMENRHKQLYYYFKGKAIYESVGDTLSVGLINGVIAIAYSSLAKYDSALIYAQKEYDLILHSGHTKWLGGALMSIGFVHLDQGNYPLALKYLRGAHQILLEYDFPEDIPSDIGLSTCFLKLGQFDSSIQYAQKAFEVVQKSSDYFFSSASSDILAKAYKSKNKIDSANKYFELSIALRDSSNHLKSIRQFLGQDYDEQIHRQDVETARIEYKNQFRIYGLLAGLGVMILIAILLVKNNRQRKKTNSLLKKQKEEIESALAELKSAQSQLIQSEKMASLGELTAGIAHEIQNPLNFVNNFSEVNKELIDEASQAIKAGNKNDAIELLSSLRDNEEKISNHGKRADSIVKGMLQHSRTSAGQKEPTDINALADEYLRLSYHGLRAKDKSFNATIQTEFDPTIGKIDIVPQDVGRVLLNLYNNAFNAVFEKAKRPTIGYEPRVSVSTKRIGDKIKIMVKDNGVGIPQKIIDKIFQPFFTTKPTGQGTGLGLSMSYDIIKAHGGELKVESKEGEGAEFVVLIPVA